MKLSYKAFGTPKADYLNAGIETYYQRIKHYHNFTFDRYKAPKKKGAGKGIQAMQIQEGKLILEGLTPADYFILLDERGKMFTSEEFASHLQRLLMGGHQRVVFVSGGAYGFSPDVYDRAQAQIALSKMTFSHLMIQLIFLEQVYRAFTILKGEPYHHK